MSVLERAELEASPLADLHLIADQLGIDGYRRLRKAELIGAILKDQPGGDVGTSDAGTPDDEQGGDDGGAEATAGAAEKAPARERGTRSRRGGARRRRGGREARDEDGGQDTEDEQQQERSSNANGGGGEAVVEGVVELLGNGSAFLRVQPPDPSDDDVYISAAQVRRCELMSGDRVGGPARAPRRSERYASLVRVDTINGAPADSVAEGTRYDDLPATLPSERFSLGDEDPTLHAIEWTTPLGRGSRAVIVGPARAGKTETLRRLAGALAGQSELEVTLVLAGVRPEEIGEWQSGPVPPAVALHFGASADAQGQAVERTVEIARRSAARGGHAVVLIDTLDGVHLPVARKALAAARNIVDGGSLTVIATASKPYGGETTVISLDARLASTGRAPEPDLATSGTLRPELLVGEEGAHAIAGVRAQALGMTG